MNNSLAEVASERMKKALVEFVLMVIYNEQIYQM